MEFLKWPKELLKHLEFKCSFHYLELKKINKLEIFAENVKRIWEAGASANIEITPSDELIPYIDEVKEFSLKHFGALPHITIARDDRTEDINYLTQLSIKDYDKVWGSFESDFWKFKKKIFGIHPKGFCHAGKWSLYVDLTTGESTQCYCGKSMGNIFSNPNSPIPEEPIGICPISHCYNGHMFLTLGLIPGHNDTHYGDIRDRIREDGSHWLQPELKQFFNCKVEETNKKTTCISRYNIYANHYVRKCYQKLRSILKT